MFIDTHMHEMTYSPDSFLKLEEIWVLADIVNSPVYLLLNTLGVVPSVV